MSTVKIDANKCDFPDCQHVWYSKKKPPRCAKCKRPNWDKPKGWKPKVHPEPSEFVRKEPKLPKSLKLKPRAEGIATMTESGDLTQSTAHGWEKPLPLVSAPEAIVKALAVEHPKIGEKCPHGWANWLQCEKCNPKAGS